NVETFHRMSLQWFQINTHTPTISYMNCFLLSTSCLSLLLLFLFPSRGKCQNIYQELPKQQDLPKVNLDVELLLNSSHQEIPLKLADVVYLALQNNRDLKIAYLVRIVDQKQLFETESQFNPTFGTQLSVNVNNSQTGSSINTNTTAAASANFNLKIPSGGNLTLTWQGQNQLSRVNSSDSYTDTNTLSQSFNFNFSQPLLRGFGKELNILSIKRAKLTENANILNFKNTIGQTITNTILNYRNLLLAQEKLKIEQLSFANAKKDLERLEALFQFGRIAKNDLVERQSDIAQQEVNLVNTQTSLEQAISDLTKVIDLPVTKKLIAIETPTPPTSLNLPSFDEMLELAKSNNSGYLSAINAVENAKFSLAEAKNQQQLDLKFNVSYALNNASNTQDTNNLSSSLILNHEFGNASQDNAVSKSEISLQNANYSLTKTHDNLREELKNKIRNVQDTFKQIKLAQQATKLAESKVINAKEKMRLMTDIITFEKGLVDAKNQELNATINHLNSMTQLEQFLGTTLYKWVG
ncbi:MAG: TolC family protein, partial [Dolichospermum sp.]